MGSLLNDVNTLITKKVGDLSRLEHIKETLENNKQLYNSDRNYIDGLIKNIFYQRLKMINQKISHQIIM